MRRMCQGRGEAVPWVLDIIHGMLTQHVSNKGLWLIARIKFAMRSMCECGELFPGMLDVQCVFGPY